jgi:hypothetical protein
LASSETLNPSPCPPLCKAPAYVLSSPSCPPLLPPVVVTLVLLCSSVQHSGHVRTSASLISEDPPFALFESCRFLDFVLFLKTREKKDQQTSNKNAKTDRSLRPPPPPRLCSSRINVTAPRSWADSPLHPPNIPQPREGKGKSLKTDEIKSVFFSLPFQQRFPPHSRASRAAGPRPNTRSSATRRL